MSELPRPPPSPPTSCQAPVACYSFTEAEGFNRRLLLTAQNNQCPRGFDGSDKNLSFPVVDTTKHSTHHSRFQTHIRTVTIYTAHSLCYIFYCRLLYHPQLLQWADTLYITARALGVALRHNAFLSRIVMSVSLNEAFGSMRSPGFDHTLFTARRESCSQLGTQRDSSGTVLENRLQPVLVHLLQVGCMTAFRDGRRVGARQWGGGQHHKIMGISEVQYW